MKYVLVTVLNLIIALTASSQTDEIVTSTDTLILLNPRFKKTLMYDNGDATIFIDYYQFKKSFDKFWKERKNRLKSYLKVEKMSPELRKKTWFKTWLFLDSMHFLMKGQVKRGDTISIKQSDFNKFGIGTGHKFEIQIENGQCSIQDKLGNIHTKIIRKKAHYQRDVLYGWGGRKYYFFEHAIHFFVVTDWLS